MYKPRATRQFRKDRKRCRKRGWDLTELDWVMARLVQGKRLERKYRPHTLGGEYDDCWEGHLRGDWLLIWRIEGETIVFVRTGSHADLFE